MYVCIVCTVGEMEEEDDNSVGEYSQDFKVFKNI